ncbi:Pectate lyase plyB 1 [Phlyctema vagabunda]|uniref:Pectate lyase plyB 1 n=1 Tax=Phlyctema vagabunda TaxID=108571 RepID=A0ABR4PG22_9HELO
MLLLAKYFVALCTSTCAVSAALVPYTGPAPDLPADRQPFGFGVQTTGGAAANTSSVFLVDNMIDLRAALTLPYPRIVYVKGNVAGNEITSGPNGTVYADCQWYIDNGPVKNFNFTQYIMSLNSSYTDSVAAAAAANGTIDGYNATEYLVLLKKMNGWRPQAQNSQKIWAAINVQSNLTLIGWDGDAYLNGVSLIFNAVSNIIVRNLKMSSVRDCFPAPETLTSWNARYDAMSLVTSTNFWIDGNIFADGPAPVAPEPVIWNYQVDRYDGLVDCEDGSDNITFSHNVVANHHKSMLLGGGLKERERDLGKMRFTLFGNHFLNSNSRNPLMRFGTFYIINNLFTNLALNASFYQRPFQYNFGIYTESSALVAGNIFYQDPVTSGPTKIFSYSGLTNSSLPSRLCVPAAESNSTGLANLASPGSELNGVEFDLQADAQQKFEQVVATSPDTAVEGSLLISCNGFKDQEVPIAFDTADDVEAYVRAQSGQLNSHLP